MKTIVINAVSAKSGGAATYLLNLSRDLPACRPADRFILCLPPATAGRMGPLPKNLSLMETLIGLGPAWRRFLWDQLDLRRLLRARRADLLLSSSDFGMFFPPCRQILLLRNPVFFSSLYLRQILPRMNARFKLQFRLRRWLVGLSVRHAHRVITASQSMLRDARRFIRIPGKKAAVVPFGVPLEKFREKGPAAPEGELRLLYVSEYSDYKNLTALLKAVSLLPQKGLSDFSLSTTANPRQFSAVPISSREEDLALCARPEVARHLKMVGSVSYAGIPDLYRRHDLFVFPSLAESFGHPLVEAMASGLPVLASDIPICREICGEAALYFNPLDPEDLAGKILLLHRDSALQRQLGRAGRQRAESTFDWATHVGRLAEMLDGGAGYSYQAERTYYARNWPREAKPYLHLERYLRFWMDPEREFAGKRVLDIGAGECAYTRLIADRFSPRWIVACDLFPERLGPASRTAPGRPLKFAAGDCFRLPFRDGAFDVIFGSFILHQLPQLPSILGEISRVLSGSGTYLGIEPSPYAPLHLLRYLAGNHSPNQYLLTPWDLSGFRRAGFELKIRHFSGRSPFLRGPVLGACMGITARRSGR